MEEGIQPKWVRPTKEQWDKLIYHLGNKDKYLVSACMKEFYDPVTDQMKEEYEARINLYQREIEIQRREIEILRHPLVWVGTIEVKDEEIRLYRLITEAELEVQKEASSH